MAIGRGERPVREAHSSAAEIFAAAADVAGKPPALSIPPPRLGQPVAFYPAPGDPGAALSSAVVATVVKVHPDGSCDLMVEGVPVEGVSRLAKGQHATPRTWSP